MFSKKRTRFTCLRLKSTWRLWTRLFRRSASKTNHNRLQHSASPPEEVPDAAAVVVSAVSAVVEAEEAGEASPRVSPEAPDTVPTPQRAVATVIIVMATELGFV